jgi:hypothetical protein
MRKIVIALVVGGLGFAAYLALSGVRMRDVRAWTERNLGVRLRASDFKDAPATGYMPVTPSR